MARRPDPLAASLDAVLRPVLAFVLRYGVKPVLAPAVPIRVQRAWATAATRLSTIPRGVRVSAETLNGVPAERWRPSDAPSDVAAIYLHGGGFCLGSALMHRAIGARLAAVLDAPVYVPDYRLAPEHPFPDALDDALEAYAAVRARGYASDHIALVGDSAGGGLALSLMIALRERGKPLPAAAVLFSPWVDLTLSGATIDDTNDPIVSKAWLAQCAVRYRGSVSASDPWLSPLFAPLAGLPPLAIHAGSREILLDDAVRLRDRARGAGLDVDYRQYDGLWHNSQLQGGVLPTAQASFDDAAAFVRRHWPQSTAS